MRDLSTRHGVAWVLLTLALAAHVADEALNDFLSVYNPIARAVRSSLPFLPMPTFTFDVWLAGLILAVLVLLALTPLVMRGAFWTVPFSYFYSILMIVNGLGHFAGSVFLRRPMPGVYSSPLLLAAAIFLLVTTRKRSFETRHPGGAG
jgi:hypothetical protein